MLPQVKFLWSLNVRREMEGELNAVSRDNFEQRKQGSKGRTKRLNNNVEQNLEAKHKVSSSIG